jgi:predicted kinase
MKFVLVAGLPGSGKTFYAKARSSAEGLLLIDDPRPETGGFGAAVEGLQGHKGAVITDPWFCSPVTRAAAEKVIRTAFPEAVFEWVFFEPDVEACAKNLWRRATQGDTRKVTLQAFVSVYVLPPGVERLPVWK